LVVSIRREIKGVFFVVGDHKTIIKWHKTHQDLKIARERNC